MRLSDTARGLCQVSRTCDVNTGTSLTAHSICLAAHGMCLEQPTVDVLIPAYATGRRMRLPAEPHMCGSGQRRMRRCLP
jgi:hypothetical protein